MQRFTQTHPVTSLALAAALSAVGIPMSEAPRKGLTTKGDTYSFQFEEASPCGTYRTREMIRAWDSPTFHEENPEHPFAYIKCALDNREAILDFIKQGKALVVIEKNGKKALISENASPELQTKIFAKL